MSHTVVLLPSPSAGRVTAFCEVLSTGAAAHKVLSPASIAGLPPYKGKYSGLPAVSKPSSGSVLLIEPLFDPKPQLVPLSMLLPPLVTAPRQLPLPVLLATMELISVTDPTLRIAPPLDELLPEKVLLVMVSEPVLHWISPPPCPLASVWFPEKVELLTVAVPPFERPPPSLAAAW